MRLKIILMAAFAAILFNSNAQITIEGKVMDANTGEELPCIILTNEVEIKKSVNGSFTIIIEKFPQSITVKSEDFEDEVVIIENNKFLNIYLEPKSLSMQAVQISASIANKNRRTPIVYTNVTGKSIAENLGSADLPTLLNNTPGVYATQQGGGAGDARISIRGFNQRNIAVMVDGIPVNDMENGEVYWSNWYGLGPVTQLTQVQRGLGSSRIANPSVGGTINMITKSTSNKFWVNASTEIGDSKYKQFSATINTGNLGYGFNALLSMSYRQSDGYVDGLFDNMFFFFGKINKSFGKKLNVSFNYIGSPQQHGQRSFKALLPIYSSALAIKQGVDTVLANMPRDKGIRYNQHLGLLKRNLEAGSSSTLFNERVNEFHKPQAYFKIDYKPNVRIFNTAILYLSIANGGGVQNDNIRQVPSLYGQYDFQSAYKFNTKGSAFVPGAIDLLYHPTLRKSSAILNKSMNNHQWIGFLNTLNYKFNRQNNINVGIDARTYSGDHYRKVHDLLGGEYFRPTARDTLPGFKNTLYKVGDIYGFRYIGYVNWLGLFGEYEYTADNYSFFANLSGNRSWYKRKDFFRITNGKPAETSWVDLFGGNFKTGGSYSITKQIDVFSNIGYLNKPTRFNNVFSQGNTIAKVYKNEEVLGAEIGAKYGSKNFSLDGNIYITNWKNRPLNRLASYTTPDGDQFSYNINGISARHTGMELKGIYKFPYSIDLEGIISLGNWKWTSGANAIVRDDNGDSIAAVKFDATGVFVGDAAQNQLVVKLSYRPEKTLLKGFYFNAELVYFAKHYANFEPILLTGSFERKQSAKIPNYYTINSAIGYSFNLEKKIVLRIFANARNVLNNIYVSDADHNSRAGVSSEESFKPTNLEVFVSPGFRYTTGVSIDF